MKKLCGIFFLLMALVFAGSQNNRAEAYDEYVGTWRSGYDAYLMTETVRYTYGDNFKCTVKAVQGRNVMYIDYSFYWSYGECRFSNSDGIDNSLSNGTSIEKNIYRYVVRTSAGRR